MLDNDQKLLTDARRYEMGSVISKAKKSMKKDEDRFKKIKDMLKESLTEQFRDGDKTVSITGENFEWVLSRSVKTSVDQEKMEADGILEKYQVESTTYKFEPKKKKEDK